jgi:cytochrome c oxidase cbb3-type subunit 1
VHSGALGWVGFITFGAHLLPGAAAVAAGAACTRCSWSTGTSGSRRIGIVLYIAAMWVAGIMQGLMWRAYDQLRLPAVHRSSRPSSAMHPYYVIRALGGVLYPDSARCSWPINLIMTVRSQDLADASHAAAGRPARR